jgi:hypothetical protein
MHNVDNIRQKDIKVFFSGTWQIFQLAKTIIGCTFYKDQIYIFESSMKKIDFLIPHSPYLRKKKFYLLGGTTIAF